MSGLRRIREAGSDASPLARDLVGSASSDAPPSDARARAKARLERALGADGVTRNISARPDVMASGEIPLPSPTPLASASTETAAALGSRQRTRWIAVSVAAAVIIGVSATATIAMLRGHGAIPPPTQLAPASSMSGAASTPTTGSPQATTANAGASWSATGAQGSGTTTAAAGTPGGAPAASSAGGAPLVASAGSTGGHEHGSHAGAHDSAGGGGGGGGGSGGTTALAAAPASGGTCSARCHGDIQCLLNCGVASGGGGANQASGGSGTANLPMMPSRDDVIGAMNRVRAAVEGCAPGQHSAVPVSVTFSSSGRVSHATVVGALAGGSTAACIAREVRAASVPAFIGPSFTVNYPFFVH